ncbi:MAG: hypothetical protein JST00_29565 [Deltaproteobacteria bacterium]|nr:hypothetical protein [Deltaproteobacteria bacterium]
MVGKRWGDHAPDFDTGSEDAIFPCRAIVPGLPLADTVAEIERLEPLVVGFSCALPSELPAADTFIADVRAKLDARWQGEMMICGLAVRGPGASRASAAGTAAAATLEDVERIVAEARARAGRPSAVIPTGG